MKSLFTPEELAELAAADAEIDASFRLTNEDIKRSREADKAAMFDRLPPEKKKIAAKQRAYREANREEIAAKARAYYEANREEIAAKQRAYYEKNREKKLAYQRAYDAAHREEIAARQLAYREANRDENIRKARERNA